MLIRTTYFIALAATISAAFYPSLAVAWLACIVWAIHFYTFHESATLAGKARTGTGIVVAFGSLLTVFYLAVGGWEFALLVASTIALTLLLRAVLPRHFPQPTQVQ